MAILDKVRERLLKFFLALKEDDWVMWRAEEDACVDACAKLNGCYFVVKQMPLFPKHPNCRCRLWKIAQPIPNVTATAECDIRKFTEYVFNESNQDGKRELFTGWGFAAEDSAYLREMFMKQALQNYCAGQYTYVGVTRHCVKIAIIIRLPGRSGEVRVIKTGWNIHRDGRISLATPFAGFET